MCGGALAQSDYIRTGCTEHHTMKTDLNDLKAFLSVAHAGGFRQAARMSQDHASTLSEAVRRLEASLGVRLLNRTTRSVNPTDAGRRLIDRLDPALNEVEAALEVVRGSGGEPAGTLRLNVPPSAARLVLPSILPGFLSAYPEIQLEIVTDDGFVDVVAAGCDAGIRYGERLELDMIAIPVGPRFERIATAASPGYLSKRGRPSHPKDLLSHECLLARFGSGAIAGPWEFEREGEVVRIEPRGQLTVQVGAAIDLTVDMAIAGVGVIHLFEDWLRPYLESGALEAVLPEWWQTFSGPFLYYPDRRLVPSPLRAFLDYVKSRP
jgi:DNA-binding transcriptional LysR family regulator